MVKYIILTINNIFKQLQKIKLLLKKQRTYMLSSSLQLHKVHAQKMPSNPQTCFKLFPISPQKQDQDQSISWNSQEFIERDHADHKLQQIMDWFESRGIYKGAPQQMKANFQQLNRKKLLNLVHANSCPGNVESNVEPMSPLLNLNQCRQIKNIQNKIQKAISSPYKTSPKKENIPSPVKKNDSASPIKKSLMQRRKANKLKLMI